MDLEYFRFRDSNNFDLGTQNTLGLWTYNTDYNFGSGKVEACKVKTNILFLVLKQYIFNQGSKKKEQPRSTEDGKRSGAFFYSRG